MGKGSSLKHYQMVANLSQGKGMATKSTPAP